MRPAARLWREARSAWLPLALAVGLGLMAGVVVVGQARALSSAVSRAFLDGQTLAQVVPLLGILLLLAPARAALSWGSDAAANRLAGQVKRQLRERLVAHLVALGPAYSRQERSGELVTSAVEGIEALDAFYRGYLPQVALAALVPVTVLLFVFPLDWVSALILLVTAPLIPLFMALIGNLADGLTRRQWTALSRMSAHFLDVLQGLNTLKLLGRSVEQAEAIADVSDDFRRATMGVLRVAFLSALALEMVATLGTAVVAVQVGLRLLYGRLAFEQALFVLILAPEFYLPLRLLGTRFHAGTAGVAAAQRIFQVLDVSVSGPETGPVFPGLTAGAGEAGPALGVAGVRLDEVYVAFDGGLRPALRGFSLSLCRGERVALVGPSGAGKSTVAALLLRFVDANRGTMVIDTGSGGLDLRTIPAEIWRQQVAWVPQAPYLFYGSVEENIRLGRPGATADEVAWAARQAHAHEFIEALPRGYDTLIGERGARLSGGQAQRLALARAFLKDAPLLILDEATANLDPETEDQIQEALARLLRGRTALIIAHRLNTVIHADRIVVMAEGRAVQEGTHASLKGQEGLYRQLIAAHGGERKRPEGDGA